MAAIDAQRQTETYQAVPELARLERQAPGWGCLAMVGTAGLGAVAVVVLLLWSALAWWLALARQLLLVPLAQLAPNSASWWLAGLVLGGVLLIFFSPRWRGLMRDATLWGETHSYDAAGVAHLAAATVSRAGMTLLAASFAAFTLFAPAFLLLRLPSTWEISRAALLVLLPREWLIIIPLVPYALLLLLPFLFVDWRRRKLRWGWVGLAFVAGGFLALVWLLQEFDWGPFYALRVDRLWPMSAVGVLGPTTVGDLPGALFILGAATLWRGIFGLWRLAPPIGMISLTLLLGAAHPLGLSFSLARLFYLPYALFRNTWAYVRDGARLRRHAETTLENRLWQNDQCVQGDGWATVCETHLRRFVERRAPRSYWRVANYHVCPACQLDSKSYNRVDCIAVLLDESMTATAEQRGRTLYLNGLSWSPVRAGEVKPPFDALVIGEAHRHDVEMFVANCHQVEQWQRSLNGAPCKILKEHPIAENLRNMLSKETAAVQESVTLSDNLVPCRLDLRRRYVGRRRLSRWLGFLLVVFLLGALFTCLWLV